ncbi:MAG: zinc ribbon domain-containing protein [Treponema sp.]|jgi:putative FmdB family regulatory protein|nr:zinc ribbon domain-containing protein [Treponema sp.]
MPTYEYECKDCGHTFEVFQSMSDAPLKICPECGKEVRRLINGGSGVIFKGSGFYVTDKKGGGASAETKGGETKSAAGNSASSAAPDGVSPASEKPAAKKTETASPAPPAAARD